MKRYDAAIVDRQSAGGQTDEKSFQELKAILVQNRNRLKQCMLTV
jgi:hypothetical protein